MSPRDVEISIVNHENREMVRACLLSLPAACAGTTWHATVIDNVSGDGSLEMLAADFSAVGVIANPVRLGFGANHNQVLRRLIEDQSARYALVLNDDTELRPDAVRRMVEAMDLQPELGAVVPTVVDRQERRAAGRISYPDVRSCLRQDRTGITELPDEEHGWLQGCCILIRRAALEAIGLYDERFFLFYEDTDLSRRLVEAGWSLGVSPEATVVHHGHASVFKPGMFEITPRQGLRSRYLYFSKYYGPRRARLVSLAGRAVMLARAAKAALVHRTGDTDRQARARRLLIMARFDPRRPLPPEVAAQARPGPAPAGQVGVNVSVQPKPYRPSGPW
jgi:N-acetylglucosaminyl-diphospho-decaprenol L-rhamnosyltransferase